MLKILIQFLMSNAKTKAIRKKEFEKDELKGIKEYKQAIKKSKGQEKQTYKQILPQEEQHLRKIKNI